MIAAAVDDTQVKPNTVATKVTTCMVTTLVSTVIPTATGTAAVPSATGMMYMHVYQRGRNHRRLASKFRRPFPLHTAPIQSPAGEGKKDHKGAARGGVPPPAV